MLSELANYLGRIEDLRSQVSGLIAELPAEALNWRPIEGKDDHATNSLAILATHIAGAEHFWIAEVVGGRPATRDRDAEFATVATFSAEIIQLLEKTAQETREVFSTLSESELNGTRQAKGRTVPVRWCILHVIDHTSLHLGHMQITYQLWAGGKSIPSPLWFERLSTNQEF
ncbi:MAG: DinB family protein [Anaerolineales bacterium]|nr:DinB family protein [Anaerolineales bacterium]